MPPTRQGTQRLPQARREAWSRLPRNTRKEATLLTPRSQICGPQIWERVNCYRRSPGGVALCPGSPGELVPPPWSEALAFTTTFHGCRAREKLHRCSFPESRRQADDTVRPRTLSAHKPEHLVGGCVTHRGGTRRGPRTCAQSGSSQEPGRTPGTARLGPRTRLTSTLSQARSSDGALGHPFLPKSRGSRGEAAEWRTRVPRCPPHPASHSGPCGPRGTWWAGGRTPGRVRALTSGARQGKPPQMLFYMKAITAVIVSELHLAASPDEKGA